MSYLLEIFPAIRFSWDQTNSPGFATMLCSFESKEQTKIKNKLYMMFTCK